MKTKKVLEVQNVKLSILKSFPPKLSITAFGTVPTSGWTDGDLIPYIYIQPPVDGIYDYDFVAKPPEQPVTQVITPIVANKVEPLPSKLKGIRVHASTNTQVALLGESDGGTVCVKGMLTDEGIECPTLRTSSGELYTLVGDLKGCQVGDEVYVAGSIAKFSFCQQGITISVSFISKCKSFKVPEKSLA